MGNMDMLQKNSYMLLLGKVLGLKWKKYGGEEWS